jgi:hypothetical protein
MAVDVEERPAARARRDDVPRPDLLEHRPPRHGEAIVRRSSVGGSRRLDPLESLCDSRELSMKIVSVDSVVLSVPTPKPIALEFREHRLVVHELSVHVAGALSNGFLVEYMDWMPPDLFVDVPRPDPADGLIAIPDRPGHGMALAPDAERKYRLR